MDPWNFILDPASSYQDPTGEYVAKWVPELARLKKPFIHQPWCGLEPLGFCCAALRCVVPSVPPQIACRSSLRCRTAPEATLAAAGVVLGTTYPHRIVADVAAARAQSDAWVRAAGNNTPQSLSPFMTLAVGKRSLICLLSLADKIRRDQS